VEAFEVHHVLRPEVLFWQIIARRTAFCIGLLMGSCSIAAGQAQSNSVYEKAIRDFQNGRAADAENTLRSVLQSHPQDLQALSLIAVVLDSERHYSEAEQFYTRALKIAPRSAAILNNLGDHYLAVNDLKKAQESFHAVLAVDSHHANANLQMAQLSVQAGHGAVALGYLTHLKDADQAEPIAQLLMAQAYALTGKCDSASKKLEELEGKTGLDATFNFSMGMAFATCKQYGPAENSFSEALKSDPTNFDILYNLALAARHNGDLPRAQQAFVAALGIKPDDPDALSAYGRLLMEEKDFMGAAAMLNHAANVAPERSDVLLLLAHATEELEFFGEAADVYQRYLKLHPDDDVAHREHGFDLVRAVRTNEGLPELQQYLSKHPENIQGLYELAIGEITGEPEKALLLLDKILLLHPEFGQARYTRAALNFQADKLSESLDDLQQFLKQDPKNPNALDLMGQIYLKQDRAQDAGQVLKEAADLAPHNRTILWHYSEVLRKLRRTDELNAVMAELRRVSESDDGSRHARTGLLDFLNLSPTQQNARYLASMRTAVAENPRDVLLKSRLAKVLLDRGDTDEAMSTFQSILAGGADNDTLADCGRTLVRHEQYQLATGFLQRVPNPGLDLIIALLHTAGPEAALEKLDNVLDSQRDGDYYLLRAQVLDSAGKPGEAADSLNRGIRSSPTRADMYVQAAEFLIKHGHSEQAADMLEQATCLVPNAAELWMDRALVLALVKRYDEALKVLAQIESRWPEWSLPYLVNGILLEKQLKPAEARQMLDRAISLGSGQADAYYYKALVITETDPKDITEAHDAISQAIALNPEDAAMRTLAGKILLDGKDYKRAVEQLEMAVRLQPTLVRAHDLLRTAYLALGNHDKAAEQVAQIKQITTEDADSDHVVTSINRLLFSVRPQ
jgi:tetratricopeptide (TPR) repeat protein